MGDEIRVETEENELSLEEMSQALPDTSTIMTRVGECWWHLMYAARGGNWPLAEYYLKRVRKLENTLKVLRPKHAERLVRFQEQALPEVIAALESHDLPRFERAYQNATDMANELHAESGYPYIKWVLPAEPPKGLQFEPVVQDELEDAESTTDERDARIASGDGHGKGERSLTRAFDARRSDRSGSPSR